MAKGEVCRKVGLLPPTAARLPWLEAGLRRRRATSAPAPRNDDPVAHRSDVGDAIVRSKLGEDGSVRQAEYGHVLVTVHCGPISLAGRDLKRASIISAALRSAVRVARQENGDCGLFRSASCRGANMNSVDRARLPDPAVRGGYRRRHKRQSGSERQTADERERSASAYVPRLRSSHRTNPSARCNWSQSTPDTIRR